MSILLHPLAVGGEPLLWRDWSRKQHRRVCMQLLRHQRVEVMLPEISSLLQEKPSIILSRASHAHSRLCWTERLECNAHALNAGRISIRLFGVPDAFAAFLDLTIARDAAI